MCAALRAVLAARPLHTEGHRKVRRRRRVRGSRGGQQRVLRLMREARQVIGEFIERYNTEWLLERHGDRTPAEVRRALTRQAA